MLRSLLLATDLDRTVLPNGAQEESPDARARFSVLAAHDEVTLVYVSGRREALLKEAIEQYVIPVPAYAIGDVGTTVFKIVDNFWKPVSEWSDAIASDWNGKSHQDLKNLFSDMKDITLQEPEAQNTFKLSYFTPVEFDKEKTLHIMQERLQNIGVHAELIWSIDETKGMGLLDVLPKSATKIHALKFLMKMLGFEIRNTVFCGDSGNDMPALTSGLNAVLVKNAMPQERDEAVTEMAKQVMDGKLYCAQGNFLGMNGNYSAGVLEGVAHFFPETEDWMKLR